MTQSGSKDMTQGGHEEKPMGMDKQGKQDQLTRGENDEEGILINFERRVTRLERWVFDRMSEAATESNVWDSGIPWRRENEGRKWSRWNGSSWIRVDQDDLRSRKRRKISRSFRRMVVREQNGMEGLPRELRNGIRAVIDESNIRCVNVNSESDERSKGGDVDNEMYQRCVPSEV